MRSGVLSFSPDIPFVACMCCFLLGKKTLTFLLFFLQAQVWKRVFVSAYMYVCAEKEKRKRERMNIHLSHLPFGIYKCNPATMTGGEMETSPRFVFVNKSLKHCINHPRCVSQ